MRMMTTAIVGLVACGSTSAAPPPANQGSAAPAGDETWEVPPAWRSETIPFPLDFAPALAHKGVEELRFPPGFLKPGAHDYWAYAFVWRLTDGAKLDGMAMGAELTTYFRGLIASVDEKHQVTTPDQITATAIDVEHVTEGPGDILLALRVHLFDAFNTGAPVDLEGSAKRVDCPGGGSLWTFALARPDGDMRAAVEELAASATCTQHALF